MPLCLARFLLLGLIDVFTMQVCNLIDYALARIHSKKRDRATVAVALAVPRWNREGTGAGRSVALVT